MTKAPYRILLIEDDSLIGELVSFILQREGYEVQWLLDGRAGSEAIAGQAPVDLVIMDLVLPYVSGFDLLEQLKSNTEWAGCPVLFLSGSDDERDIARAFQAGAEDYVRKPFQPVELSARIKRLLRAF